MLGRLFTVGAPSVRPRWATRSAKLVVVLALSAFTFWVHLAEFGAPLEWDSHIFMIVAKQLRYAQLPYRDLWELKPPGIFYYLAAIFAVLGEALWSVRFVDFALYLCAGLAFYRLCRREVTLPFALTGTAAWLYVSHHQSFNMGGVYTEEYAAINGIFAVACAATYAASGHARWAFASGMAVAAAALFKHPGAVALVPATVLITRRPALRAYALLLLGGALPLLVVVGYFWARGALADFVECNFWALIVHGRFHQKVDQALLTQRLRELATHGWTLLEPFPILYVSLGIGVPFALLWPSWFRFATLLWAVLDLLGVAAQRQYAQHHFILTFPSTCLLGTLVVAALFQPRPREQRLVALTRVAACAVAVWLLSPSLWGIWEQRLSVVRAQWNVLMSGPSAWPRSPAREPFEAQVGRYVRERTAPTDRIHVQGYNGSLLGVYWDADRRVATRYFYEVPYPIDQTQELAELQRNRPAYVVVAAQPPFLFLWPWLAADYSIESVKWLDYKSDIWVRTERAPFSAGASTGLSAAPELGGLVLPSAQSFDGSALAQRLPVVRRGQWTSPVLPVRSDNGTVFIDWNPRADVAWNRSGRGFAQADATFAGPDNDVRAVIGVPTKRGYWTGWPRRNAQAVTVQFGFPAVIDQIDLVPNDPKLLPARGCDPAVIEFATQAGEAAEAAFQPVEGSWETRPYGVRTFRSPSRVAAAVRVVVTPGSCGVEGGLRRIRARGGDMGITVRYRTAAAPELDRQPWRPLNDTDDLLWVPASRYIQVQYELWSAYADVTPVLRAAQVGRMRFELDQPPAVASAPPRGD